MEIDKPLSITSTSYKYKQLFEEFKRWKCSCHLNGLRKNRVKGRFLGLFIHSLFFVGSLKGEKH